MKRQRIPNRIRTLLILTLCIALMAGCEDAKDPSLPSSTPSQTTEAAGTPTQGNSGTQESGNPQISEAQAEAYTQMLLFIREGLHQHNITTTYQVYFGEIETNYDGSSYTCNGLLTDDAYSWEENLTYTIDPDTGWYTFSTRYGAYEPVLTQDPDHSIAKEGEHAIELMKNAVYTTTVSIDTPIDAPIRYFSLSGPVSSNTFFTRWNGEPSSNIFKYLYTYQDTRSGTSITIFYPQFYGDSPEIEKMNVALQEAFFGKTWQPEKMQYVTIEEQYQITRADERYFSLRLYEYSSYAHAAHPWEGETGIILDLETGETITVRDILGDKWTPQTLLDSDAFHCLWYWIDGAYDPEEKEKEWKETMYLSDTLDDMGSRFYLTEDGLGWITSDGRYYTCMEAKLSDLGLDDWIAK